MRGSIAIRHWLRTVKLTVVFVAKKPSCHSQQIVDYALRGRQPFWTTIDHFRWHIKRVKTRFPKTGCFSLLYESDTKLIEDMHVRHTSCVTQFAKESDTECRFGDRSRYARGIKLNSQYEWCMQIHILQYFTPIATHIRVRPMPKDGWDTNEVRIIFRALRNPHTQTQNKMLLQWTK